MSRQHSTLTGSDLHEPKGASSASEGTVYTSDGAGSGAWTDPLAGIVNPNEFYLEGSFEDISSSSTSYAVIPTDCSLTKIVFVMDSAITVGDAVISLYKDGVLQGQSKTIAYTGSGEGVVNTLTLSPSISFTSGQVLKLASDGGSTDTCRLFYTCNLTAV